MKPHHRDGFKVKSVFYSYVFQTGGASAPKKARVDNDAASNGVSQSEEDEDDEEEEEDDDDDDDEEDDE